MDSRYQNMSFSGVGVQENARYHLLQCRMDFAPSVFIFLELISQGLDFVYRFFRWPLAALFLKRNAQLF